MSVTSGIMLSDNMGVSKDAMDEEGNAAADLGLVARIRESFDSLTATEREAAQFILGHLTDVLVCNSVELSQLSGISQPTLSCLFLITCTVQQIQFLIICHKSYLNQCHRHLACADNIDTVSF